MKPSPLLLDLWHHLMCRRTAALMFRAARRSVRTGGAFVGIRMSLRFAEEQKAASARNFDAWCRRCLRNGQSRACRELSPVPHIYFKPAA